MEIQKRGLGFEALPSLILFFAAIFMCIGRLDAQQSIDVPNQQSWQIGLFGTVGFPPNYTVHPPTLSYREKLLFFTAGLEAGRMITAIHGSNFLRGRGEAVAELAPYWQVHHPLQTVAVFLDGSNTASFRGDVAAYSVYGATVTPLMLRWNFQHSDMSRLVPWVQAGLGLLWTNRDFPQGYGTATQPPHATTTHINFTPQIDIGENISVHRDQIISLSVQVLQITNFGLTAYDPGVKPIINFRAGYSWWK
jgi:hypothetical protein